MGVQQNDTMGLSDEERAAMEEDDGQPGAAPAVVASDGTPGDDDTETGANDDAGDDDGSVAAGGTPNEAEEAGEAPAGSPPAPFMPMYQAEVPEDFDAKLAAISAKQDQLDADFKEGNLSFDEYRIQARQISDETATLKSQQTKAEISSEMKEQMSHQRWEWEVDQFMASVKKDAGIDYRSNDILNAALDATVKKLANDDANADKPGIWFLQEAHKQVAAVMGLNKPTAPTQPQGEQPQAKPNINRRPNLAAVPKTLGELPTAQQADTGQDEFASIDRILEGGDVMAYEAALARLPKDQQDRYLRAG